MNLQVFEPSMDPCNADGASELETQLQYRLSGQVRQFRLIVLDDGLILRGHARSYYAKQLAQHAVMGATQLPILANDIEVP